MSLKLNTKYLKDFVNADELTGIKAQVEAAAQAKIQIEQKKVEIQEKEAIDKKDYNDKLIEVKEKQVDAELAQL